jgi:hypothetical protein
MSLDPRASSLPDWEYSDEVQRAEKKKQYDFSKSERGKRFTT